MKFFAEFQVVLIVLNNFKAEKSKKVPAKQPKIQLEIQRDSIIIAKKRINRDYKGKDVEMLQVSETILHSAIENKGLLAVRRPAWAGNSFETILAEVREAHTLYLGIDKLKAQKAATREVEDIQAKALTDLADFKMEVKVGFRTDKVKADTIYELLGYTRFHDSAKNGDQEDLIQFLFKFKENMTDELRNQILATGTHHAVIDKITSHAETLSEANVKQEGLKTAKPELTDEQITGLNAIYHKVMDIAELAKVYLRNYPIKQQMFSYTKVLANLSTH